MISEKKLRELDGEIDIYQDDVHYLTYEIRRQRAQIKRLSKTVRRYEWIIKDEQSK